MTAPISFFVEGDPKGQPRARAVIRGNRAGVYDPGTADGWKAAVGEVWRNVVKRSDTSPFTTAVRLSLTFWFRRPKSHYGTGWRSAILKPSAPLHHTIKPDIDNLAKAVMDALTRLGAWKDDALVSTVIIRRRWAEARPGCAIHIKEEELS